MGQFALGIRSLLFKAAIFVVLAALLAWALGGTLFPRPSRADIPAATFGGHEWVWRVSVYDRRAFESRDISQRVGWQLRRESVKDEDQPLREMMWSDVADPVVQNNRMHFAGRDKTANDWTIYTIDESGKIIARDAMPDRLAVEQQLARLNAGLPMQNAQTIERERRIVLDPTDDSADISSSPATD